LSSEDGDIEEQAPEPADYEGIPGTGLIKGLAVTLKTMMKPAITQQYPDVKPDLPPRTRGVIALKEENCTVCWKCSRECPDWCIYIDAHKETHDPAGGGKARSAKVLDRFAIDFSLCMYCGICIEVCPFDALFWSPEFEYAEYGIEEMTHEKERLNDWTYTVLPPPALEEGAEPPAEEDEASGLAALPLAVAPQGGPALGGVVGPLAATPQEDAAGAGVLPGSAAAPTATTAAPSAAPHVEVEPDQETYDKVLAEQLATGVDRRVADGRSKRAAMITARRKAGVE
jgi:NADH-quinone oxidoreductase subunit I